MSVDEPSNLLAHHVKVLERAGVVTRHRSEGDRRRTYLTLAPDALDTLRPTLVRDAVRVVFVCTENSAPSQLAATLRTAESEVPAASAGTRPALGVHPGAIAAAHRRGVPLDDAVPRNVQEVLRADDMVRMRSWGPRWVGCIGRSPTRPAAAMTALSIRPWPTSPPVLPASPRLSARPVDPRRTVNVTRQLSIDQQLALGTAASNLAREFDGTFGAETIGRFLHSSYDEFAGRRCSTSCRCWPSGSLASGCGRWPR